MQVVERKHHIDIIINSGANVVLPELRKIFPDIKEVKDSDPESLVEVMDTDWAREMKEKMNENKGMYLRAYRQKLGMSQKDLEMKSGISRHNISLMESGKRKIGLSVARQLAPVLGCNFSEIVS